MSHISAKSPVILVVEDETLIRMDASDVLTDAGYRVIAEVNADHALTVLNVRSDIEVLFIDINMPGTLTGSALARMVDLRWRGISIIATSGRGRPAPGELPGRAFFLPKPYTPSALLGAVRVAYRSHSADGALLREQGAPSGLKVEDQGDGTARVQLDQVLSWSTAVGLLDFLGETAGSHKSSASDQNMGLRRSDQSHKH